MELTDREFLDLARHSFIRMDGAWFMAIAKKYGIEAAWDMDVEAWKQLSYIMGKYIRTRFINRPDWPDGFVEALGIFTRVINGSGGIVIREGDDIIIRVADCDTQKAIAKAGIADCGIVTLETYKGLARGLFGKDADISVMHTKNLNHGDDCCEVIVNVTASDMRQS
jgi:hypothetical protein